MVKQYPPHPKLTFKAIVMDRDNWDRYQRVYRDQVTSHQIAEVEKMLKCGTPENGFATCICLHCGERERVCFSCKSRVCSSCGKVHADNWAQQLASRMINVIHRHITFTLPSELWSLLEANTEWRKELFGAANETLRQVIKTTPGIVMVLHPYGKDLKANFHLHVLVTEGGLSESGDWEEQSFLNYKSLRKIWQYKILTRLRSVMSRNQETAELINKMYRKYSNGYSVPHCQDHKLAKLSSFLVEYLEKKLLHNTRRLVRDCSNFDGVFHDCKIGNNLAILSEVLAHYHNS